MTHIGKIVGVFLGIISGLGIVGIFIGMMIGHIFDVMRSFGISSDSYYLNPRLQIYLITFQTMGYISTSKGKMTERDIQFAHSVINRMQMNEEEIQAAKQAFLDGAQANYYYKIPENMHLLKQLCFISPQTIGWFLDMQVQAAMLEGYVNDKARSILNEIAVCLKVPLWEIDRLIYSYKDDNFSANQSYDSWQDFNSYDTGYKHKYTDSKLINAYKTLGVKESDNMQTVKRAYMKLAKKYHPDMGQHYNIDKDTCNSMFVKVQEAYNTISKYRKN